MTINTNHPTDTLTPSTGTLTVAGAIAAANLALGGVLTTSGAFASTFTMTGTTTVTFPTSGTLATAAQLPVGANPSASVGIAAVNGAAGTFMRSDGAPALSQAIAPTWTGDHTFAAAMLGFTETSPAQITANQNDYAGLAAATFALQLSSDAARDVTGLAGGSQGRLVWVTNTGAFSITLKNQDAGSTAVNRFAFGIDNILGADASVLIRYDGTASRWRAV